MIGCHDYRYSNPLHTRAAYPFQLQCPSVTFCESFKVCYVSIIYERVKRTFFNDDECRKIRIVFTFGFMFIVCIKRTFMLLDIILTRKKFSDLFKHISLSCISFSFNHESVHFPVNWSEELPEHRIDQGFVA